ncbi:MAG: histidine phosphatase family protein [Rhodocyclaceae bacterium]|nr:histidine phosphatase family protein [Rhodocyclaceae bacterium]
MDANVCYGQSDVGIAEDAAAVAARIAPLLPAAAPFYSSPLTRCRLLAEALHPAPRFDERLRELAFGRWEMRTWDDIGRDAVDAWAADPLHYAAHGGESIAMLRRRAAACAREIGARHDEAVLVIHAGVMKALAVELLGLPDAAWFSTSFVFGSVTLIEDGRLVWQNK